MLILNFSGRLQRRVGPNIYQERRREQSEGDKEVEQAREEGREDEGHVEKDTGSRRRKNRAEVIYEREADV